MLGQSDLYGDGPHPLEIRAHLLLEVVSGFFAFNGVLYS